jgi:short-subunit dehydrogenase
VKIEGRIVVVTGASSGIGEAFARLAAGQGARLVLAARRKDRLDALAAELPGSLALKVDMRDPEQVRELVHRAAEHFGRIDVLVNNAGQGLHVPVEHVSLEDLEAVMELNVYGPLIAMQEVAPLMRAQGGGAIVNISSGTSRMILPGVGAYAATKCALNQLSLTARAEWEADGIVVSVVYPSVTDTEFHQKLRAGGLAGGGGNARFPAHPASYVAEAILRAIDTGEAEVVVPHGPVATL